MVGVVLRVGNSNHIPTKPFTPIPCAMLVAVPAEHVDECVTLLAPLRALKVGHVRAACERMLTTRPLVVVVGGSPLEEEMDTLREIADSISSQIVILSDRLDPARRKLELAGALRAAQTTRKGM